MLPGQRPLPRADHRDAGPAGPRRSRSVSASRLPPKQLSRSNATRKCERHQVAKANWRTHLPPSHRVDGQGAALLIQPHHRPLAATLPAGPRPRPAGPEGPRAFHLPGGPTTRRAGPADGPGRLTRPPAGPASAGRASSVPSFVEGERTFRGVAAGTPVPAAFFVPTAQTAAPGHRRWVPLSGGLVRARAARGGPPAIVKPSPVPGGLGRWQGCYRQPLHPDFIISGWPLGFTRGHALRREYQWFLMQSLGCCPRGHLSAQAEP
jgi:hypothetical protein